MTTQTTQQDMRSARNHANGTPVYDGATVELQTSRAEDNATKISTNKKSIMDKLRAIWAKTGIDWRTYQSMFKGALAPTIAIALFQWSAYAQAYTTIGYIVGIMAVISIVIAPRTKFLQTMIINIVFSGIAYAVSLLAMFCTVKARLNSTGPEMPGRGGPGTSGLAATGAETASYNSSASAVAGVWLFVEIYIVSVIRAQGPQYTVPGIQVAIFAVVSSTYGPQFNTMEAASNFAWRLLSAFYTGFAIATIVSLLIFPLTSRQVVFKTLGAYIISLREAIEANMVYMQSLEETDMFAAQRTNSKGAKPDRSPEAEAFKLKVQNLAVLSSKLQGDLPFAKREIAVGKLGPDDIQTIFRLLRAIMVPVVGLSCMSDVFELTAERRGWNRSYSVAGLTMDAAEDEDQKIRIEIVNEWHELMKALKEPFQLMTNVISQGLEHILIVSRLGPKARTKSKAEDLESEGSDPKPGDKTFSTFFRAQAEMFLKTKEMMLRSWCRLHDIDLPSDFFEHPDREDFQAPSWMNEGTMSPTHQALRKQLFLCLYLEFLLFNLARRTHTLMIAIDTMRDNGKLSRTRLVVPGYKRLRKWALSFWITRQDTHGDDERDTDGMTTTIYLGEAYKARKDPEHLQPANAWEKFTNQFRRISHLLSSPASSFGFRCACATMSVAVISFLYQTQTFATTERFFWAQIMIAISMSPSAGQSLRNFLLRILGTIVAMLLSLITWYIVDGKVAGVLVFLFIFLHLGSYVLIKYPQYTPVGMIGQITLILIIGYELQVEKLGIETATSNGQRYYPIYELGPIRLATVCAGLLIAWFWTIFPYPITEHNQMRNGLSQALYLLANYYSVMHETVFIRLRDIDCTRKDSPAHQLEKMRLKLYSKASLTIQNLRAQSQFLKFDIPIGGRFPGEKYQKLVDEMQSMLNFMSLVSLASSTFENVRNDYPDAGGQRWLRSLRKVVGEAEMTSQEITTTLSLMSAAVSAGHPLPPYLRIPEAYLLEQKLDALDRDLLSVRHIAEPGYASFAVMQVGSRCIIDDMKRVMAGVKDLVGELDFSYHIISTSDASESDRSAESLIHKRPVEMRQSSSSGSANQARKLD